MSKKVMELLQKAEAVFGEARLVSEVNGITALRVYTRLEVKGRRDAAWRPVALVYNATNYDQYLEPHIGALTEDLNRARTNNLLP